jgi:putative transposase
MCTFERRSCFSCAAVVDPVRDELLRTAAAHDVDVPAYCFMPDHLHALIEGAAQDSDLAECAAQFRQRTGYWYRRAHRRWLWQDGYYDHVLRHEDDTLSVARYIVANPTRARLCQDIRSYPFIGSSTYSTDELAEGVAWTFDRRSPGG